MSRTIYNGELRLGNINETVKVVGWVSKARNLGGIIFIDLRDITGIVQLKVLPDNKCYKEAEACKSEYVLEVTGEVVKRESPNKNIPTGDVEINVRELKIINEAKTPAILVQDNTDALEDTRLKYRYLDLRRPVMQKNFIMRYKLIKAARDYLDNHRFIEFETPILSKSTPEGARDYLVPSRIYKGEFYALPQSPQIFKQLLMVAGFDRYYQIAKCFRDEDLRADRQPEFSQLDIETSFLKQDELLSIIEGLVKYMFKETIGLEIDKPFEVMKYDDAMNNYGSDKPDTRFDLHLEYFTKLFSNIDSPLFNLDEKGAVVGVNCKGGEAHYTRKDIDKLTELVKKYQAKNLLYLKKINGTISGSIAKFVNEEIAAKLVEYGFEDGDIIFMISDNKKIAQTALGHLRNKLASDLGLKDDSIYDFKWIVDWPLFEEDGEGGLTPVHHPFTAPKEEDEELLFTNPEKCYSNCYDLVVHGYEVGGGSIRIHKTNIQAQIFKILGISEEQANRKFGFLLEALKYGTPPHGGIAFGIERLVMILTGTNNIKDVILFPKTTSAQCLMSDCPSEVDEAQLKELGIKLC